MAYPRDSVYGAAGADTAISVSAMPEHETDDLLVFFTGKNSNSGGAWAVPSDYTQITNTQAAGVSTASFFKIATSSSESIPVSSTSDSDALFCLVVAIADVDTADPVGTGFADSYTDGEEFIATDTFRVRFAELNTTTSFKTFETTGIVSASGFAVVVDAISDSVYASNGIDGSSTAVTDIYTADYANNEIDLDTNMDFTNPKSFAFVSFEQTTSQGMFQIWRIVTAIDSGNYQNNVDVLGILFDETSGFVKQEDGDTSRWFRTDGTRPFRDPTTGGAGISMNWKNPVFQLETGVSGLTPSESAQLGVIDTVDTNVDAILVDTSTTLPAQIDTRMPTTHIDATAGKVDGVALVDTTTTNTDQRGTDGANTVVPDNASITAIKAKTDPLTFTKANELDSNIQSVNDVTVKGTGEDGDPWNPV